MTALTIFLIAVSLSMDAFAVSVCGGMRLAEDRKFRGGLQYGAWFGIFQALMPFLGYHLGLYFAAWVDAYAHWIIFLILSWIGIGMIKEAHEEVSCKVITGPLTMLGLAVLPASMPWASVWALPLKGSTLDLRSLKLGQSPFVYPLWAVFLDPILE